MDSAKIHEGHGSVMYFITSPSAPQFYAALRVSEELHICHTIPLSIVAAMHVVDCDNRMYSFSIEKYKSIRITVVLE